jgi:hypothetical protein
LVLCGSLYKKVIDLPLNIDSSDCMQDVLLLL